MHKKSLLVGLAVLIGGVSFMLTSSEEVKTESVVYRKVSADVMNGQTLSPELRLIAEVDNQGFTSLHSMVAGRIESIEVKSSQHVKAGRVLVCVNRKQAKLDYQHKQHDCGLVQEQLATAIKEAKHLNKLIKNSEKIRSNGKDSFERAQKMAEKGHLSQHEFDQAQSAWLAIESEHESLLHRVEKTQSQVTQHQLNHKKCQAQLAKLEKTLHDQCLYAPENGQVTDVLVAKGAVVTPGAPLVQFVPDNERQLRAMLLSSQLEAINAGVKQVRFLKKGVGNLSFQGIVDTPHGSGFEAIFTSKNKLPHGQAYDVLVELAPVAHSLLLKPKMLYQQRYIFALKPVEDTKLYELVKVPVHCVGYRWNEQEERLNLCVPQVKKLPGPIMSTYIEGALAGMRVSLLSEGK